MNRKRKMIIRWILVLSATLFVLPGIILLLYNAYVRHTIRKEENLYNIKGNEAYFKFAERKGDGRSPAVLLIHGFGGSPYDFKPLTDELEKQGIAFHAILLPGHGTSPRNLTNVTEEEFLKYSLNALDKLKEKYGEISVVGFSMGGTLAINLAEEREVNKLILFGPYLDITRKWYYLGKPEKWAKRLYPILPYVGKIKIANINDPAGLKRYDSYKHLPVKTVLEMEKLSHKAGENIDKIHCSILWFHSRHDIASDYNSAKSFFEKIPSRRKNFIEYTRSNHMILYDYDAQDAIRRTLAFLNRGELKDGNAE